MTTLARGALELRDLVERFSSLSEDAVRACEDGDTVALAVALDARELVTSRLATLASQVQALRLGAPRAERAAVDALLAPVYAAAGHAATINATLLARADASRLEVGRQIDLLRRDREAASAYHATAPRPPGLDEVR